MSMLNIMLKPIFILLLTVCLAVSGCGGGKKIPQSKTALNRTNSYQDSNGNVLIGLLGIEIINVGFLGSFADVTVTHPLAHKTKRGAYRCDIYSLVDNKILGSETSYFYGNKADHMYVRIPDDYKGQKYKVSCTRVKA